MTTSARLPALQAFVDRVERAINANPMAPATSRQASNRIFDALRRRNGDKGNAEAQRLPVCRYVDAALSAASLGAPQARATSEALTVIEPKLRWQRRAGSESQPQAFADGHANAMIIGPGGIEARDDVWIGVSLMAPNLTYPDHSHPPEEVYLVLSGGDWRQRDHAWTEPGIGGIVYNPPGIVHAMRSGPQPLLAVWCLWI